MRTLKEANDELRRKRFIYVLIGMKKRWKLINTNHLFPYNTQWLETYY